MPTIDCKKIAALGTTTARFFSTPRGTSGADERRSATTKQPINSVPKVPKRRVAVDIQPFSGTSEIAWCPLIPAFGKHYRGGYERHEGHGHVDEQDPPPAQVLGDHPSAHHADHEPQGRHRTVNADGAVALFTLSKDGRKQRERGWHERCCAYPLDKASADEDPRLPGEPTYERRRTKEGEPCHKEALPPVKITCTPEQ